MYAAKTPKHQKRLVFQVSGKLWKRSLVMRDLQTGSLWSHILGEAMEGALKGEELEAVPSVISSWGEWKARHPATTVLNLQLSAERFDTKAWKKRKAFVLGIEIKGETKAWPYDFLGEHPVVVETFAGREMMVVFLKKSATAFAFEAPEGIKSGRLEEDQLLTDDGTRWDLWSANAVDGPLKGKRLTPIYALPSYRKAWLDFHPKSAIAGE